MTGQSVLRLSPFVDGQSSASERAGEIFECGAEANRTGIVSNHDLTLGSHDADPRHGLPRQHRFEIDLLAWLDLDQEAAEGFGEK